MLKAITINEDEKFLRQISSVVDFNDKELQQNLKDIREYCTFIVVYMLWLAYN